MSVDTTHPDYQEHVEEWELLNDVCKGEKAIKEAGIKYLPMLGDQKPEEYNAYKMRGSFFNALARTIQGLTGFIFRKPVTYALPKSVEALLPSIMSTGQGFEDLCRGTTKDILKFGRVGLLVDSNSDSDPYIAVYGAQAITNWRTQFIEGEEVITLLVLKEIITEQGDDEFDMVEVTQYRAITLVPVKSTTDPEETVNKVEVNIWQKKKGEKGHKEDWKVVETLYPEILGKRQEKILFYLIGSEQNTAAVNKPPFIDMAYINIDHWRLSVDYRHGLHFCSLPTPWAAGFDDDTDLTIGPVRAWKSDDPNASCGYLEFSGQGLAAVEKAIKADEEQMAILGARIIENTRSRIETAEAARIRQSGESGALTSIVKNMSEGLTACFKGLSEWMGVEFAESYIKLNTDFIDTSLTPQELAALFNTYQGGGMSLSTFLYNLDRGELLPPDQTIEDEMTLIEAADEKSFKKPIVPEPDDELEEEELDDDGNPIEKDDDE